MFAVRGENTFDRPIKSGLRLLDRHYEVEVFEETRPDAPRGSRSGWSHIERTAPEMLAALVHREAPHRHTSAWSKGALGAGVRRALSAWPRSNCRGPHKAQPNLCPKGKEARQAAKGWRSQPLPPGQSASRVGCYCG